MYTEANTCLYAWLNGFIQGDKRVCLIHVLYLASDLYCTCIYMYSWKSVLSMRGVGMKEVPYNQWLFMPPRKLCVLAKKGNFKCTRIIFMRDSTFCVAASYPT